MTNLETITMGETRKERLERAKNEIKSVTAYLPTLSNNDRETAEELASLVVGYLRLTNYKGYRHYNDFLNEAYDIANHQGRRTAMEDVISDLMTNGDVDMMDLMNNDIEETQRFQRMYAEMCNLVKEKGFESGHINAEVQKEHELMTILKGRLLSETGAYFDEDQVDVLDNANAKMLKIESRYSKFRKSLKRFPGFILKATSINKQLGKTMFFMRQLLLLPFIIIAVIISQIIIATVGISAVAKSIWS